MAESSRTISDPAVRRLSVYLRQLEELEREGEATISSAELAKRAGSTSAQIRKDLSVFGSFGKRGLGYSVPDLVRELREILGLTRSWTVALAGAGRIGAALFEYPAFRERGFRIQAVLDSDPEKVGRVWNGIEVEDAGRLTEVCRRVRAEIGILAVPSAEAQSVAERFAAAGVGGLLNFAPVSLRVPWGVVVNDVNMAVELEALSFALVSQGDEASGGGRGRT